MPADVLSALGHELRGPLGVARGYLRMLVQGGGLDERQAKAVAEAARAADRMAGLLDEVAAYARWLRGEVPLSLAAVPVARLLDDATTAAAPAPGVPPPADLTVRADATHLSPALATLASAAARALQDRDTLAISAVALGDTRPHIGIRLAARGSVPPGTERPPDLRRSGHGLGLALADRVVRAHGGTLAEVWTHDHWDGYIVRL